MSLSMSGSADDGSNINKKKKKKKIIKPNEQQGSPSLNSMSLNNQQS